MRLFVESLYGHLTDPERSINAEVAPLLDGLGEHSTVGASPARSMGKLRSLDPGWLLVGLAHNLDQKILRAGAPVDVPPGRSRPALCNAQPPLPGPVTEDISPIVLGTLSAFSGKRWFKVQHRPTEQPPPHAPSPLNTLPAAEASVLPARTLTSHLDRCTDPLHSSNWERRPALGCRLVRSERFVDCAHCRCRVCCTVFCRSRHVHCRYHGL